MRIYLAAGHGIDKDDRFDPGATHRGLIEHDLAVDVVTAAVTALRRSGIGPVKTDLEAGAGHDPNHTRAAQEANAFRADVAVEVHFNKSHPTAPSFGTGTEIFVKKRSSEAGRIAAVVHEHLTHDLRLRGRGLKERDNLGWLNDTKMPALLVEVAFLDGDHDRIAEGGRAFTRAAGEAIARGIATAFGLPWTPPSATPAQPPTLRWEVRLPTGNPSGRFATPENVGHRVTDLVRDGVLPVTVVKL